MTTINTSPKKKLPVPNEVMLDVLKFMDYKEHCKMEGTARILHLLIERYKHELALCKFHQLQIYPEFAVTLTQYRQALEITELHFDYGTFDKNAEHEKENWTKLIDDQMSLYAYAFPDLSPIRQIQQNPIDSFLIFITKEDCPMEQKLCLELPLYPESVHDLALIMFWLDQLQRVHFQWMDWGRACFNPDLLSLLYPSTNRPPLFHSRRMDFKMGYGDEIHSQRIVRFLSDSVVTECLTLRRAEYLERILDFLLIAGTRIGKVVFPGGPARSTVELQNLLIFHAERSFNPMALIGHIEFQRVDDFQYPDMRSANLVGVETTANGLEMRNYSMVNLRNSNVHFAISIGQLPDCREFKYLSIKRTVSDDDKK